MSQDMSQYEEEMRRQMEEYEAARKAEAERQAQEEAENERVRKEYEAQMRAEMERMRQEQKRIEAEQKAEAERQAREETESAARQAEMDARMEAEQARQQAEEEARWDWTTLTKRPDGSYVVNRDGLPCHLPPNDPRYAEPFKKAMEWEKTHTVEEKSAVLEPTKEMREQMVAAQEQAQRLPDLEDAVAELGEYTDETMNTNSDAVVDLAEYAAELEERIAALEGAKE